MSLKLEKAETPSRTLIVPREVSFKTYDEDTGISAHILSNCVFVRINDPIHVCDTLTIPRSQIGAVAAFLTALARTLEEHDAEIAAEFDSKKE